MKDTQQMPPAGVGGGGICPGSPACEWPFSLLVSSSEVHKGVLPSFEDSGRSMCIPYSISAHSPKFHSTVWKPLPVCPESTPAHVCRM